MTDTERVDCWRLLITLALLFWMAWDYFDWGGFRFLTSATMFGALLAVPWRRRDD